MARRRPPQSTENHERWMVSYADFITLLFAFFVVMYSTSATRNGDFRVLSDSIVRAFGLPGVSINPTRRNESGSQAVPLGIPMPEDSPGAGVQVPLRAPVVDEDAAGGLAGPGARQRMQDAQGVALALQHALGDLLAPDRLALSNNDKWVEIKIPARMLFPSASQALLADAVPMLRALAATLREMPNDLVVQGHTDNQPIRNGRFPSNWELSTARAAAVARVFEETGVDPARLSAVGFSSNRPVADNATEVGRAENRRVVVLVRTSLEPGDTADG